MPMDDRKSEQVELTSQEKLESLLQSSRIGMIGLVVAILILAGLIHWLRSWYRDRDDPAGGPNEILNQMRELHLEGDLSEEEFRSIKGQMKRPRD
ncbi:hypothetical protein KOR42_08960 [Thalassoglobus neptunius]|uniref:SHOCT domain-containing protein n=2 Tax=Thalassoglobus neptunius TaxID=1938619 RepID=A0A5C5X5Q3_9PLAN|nr:hypothetical protein KOR42_08960 [Thalassoglobus neptunius]